MKHDTSDTDTDEIIYSEKKLLNILSSKISPRSITKDIIGIDVISELKDNKSKKPNPEAVKTILDDIKRIFLGNRRKHIENHIKHVDTNRFEVNKHPF